MNTEKIETAHRLSQNTYNKNCIFKHTKLRNENTVIKPVCPKLIDEPYRLRSKQKIKQFTNIHNEIIKRTLKCLRHINRMNEHRLTEQIVELYANI